MLNSKQHVLLEPDNLLSFLVVFCHSVTKVSCNFKNSYTKSYLTYNLGRMKTERRCRKIRCRYRFWQRGIHNLFSYKNAAKNWESLKQACIDDGLFCTTLF